MAVLAVFACPARGDPQPGSEEIDAAYGGASSISLATGYERPLFDAPASATIITRDQIVASGARSLAELIPSIVGYHLTTRDGRSTQLTVRGITSRVLMLVNNVPLDQGYVNGTISLNDLLLFDVDRIEVTRGPGSALFGADAVAGIINIITRTSTAAPLAEFGMEAGTLDTYSGWMLYGTRVGEADLRSYVAFGRTDFNDSILPADAQSGIDRVLGTRASLAPGPLNSDRKVVEARGELAWSGWAVRASHRSELDFGTGTGLGFALDPDGYYDGRSSALELVHDSQPFRDWSIGGYLAYIDIRQDADLTVYPAGAFRGAFPDGVRQQFSVTENRVRGQVVGKYTGLDGHTLYIQAGGLRSEYDTLEDVRNYVVRGTNVIPTGGLAPGGGVDDPEIIGDATRDVYYGAIQDEWSLAKDWRVTAGVRFDHYSDFGGTMNPRSAIVWSPGAGATFKLLYGKAFRPPSITELESNGTFSALGNRDLRPSKIEMTELVFNHRGPRHDASIAAFHYRQKDLVQTVPNRASPTGTQYANQATDRGSGIEATLKWRFSDELSVDSSYMFQRHADSSFANANAAQAPRQLAYARLDWKPTDAWIGSVGVVGVFGRHRATGDPRPDPADYALVEAALTRRNLVGTLDGSLRIQNALDRRAVDAGDLAILPGDIPLPGRQITARLVKRF